MQETPGEFQEAPGKFQEALGKFHKAPGEFQKAPALGGAGFLLSEGARGGGYQIPGVHLIPHPRAPDDCAE